jgi:hypothetical protein
MVPQEKANELFTMYHNMIQEYGIDLGQESIVSILAIKCALIAVDELIKNVSDVNSWYWEEVKEEIEKI